MGSLREILTKTQLSIEALYIVVAASVFFLSTRVIRADASHVFAFLVAFVCLYWLHDKSKKEVYPFSMELDVKMQMLGSPRNFHMDANFINLFVDMLDFRIKNPNNFDLAMTAIGNVLQTERDLESLRLDRCVDHYEIARDQAMLALNFIHGLVYSLTNEVHVEKLTGILKRLQQLLERHLVAIVRLCDLTESRKPTRDVNSRFVEDFNGPVASDDSKIHAEFDLYI